MAQRPALRPWHEVVKLRGDLKSGELSLAIFAADLYDVVVQKGQRPVYEDPARFFALTYPTYNLRELVKDVVLRLDGRSDKAYRRLSVNYGGGKTHTLIALRHLVHNPDALPDLPAVREFQGARRLRAAEGESGRALLRQDRRGDGGRDSRARRHRQDAQASVERARLSTGRGRTASDSSTPGAKTRKGRRRRRSRSSRPCYRSLKKTACRRWCSSTRC